MENRILFFKGIAAVVISTLITFLYTGSPVQASSMSNDEVGFYVKAVIPNNQIDKDKTYFDLRVTPNQIQDIAIEIHNVSTSPITVHISINDASTNSAGEVEYQSSGTSAESLQYSLPEIIYLEEEELVVPQNSMVEVQGKLTVPENKFDGELIGGIVITKQNNRIESSNSPSITNVYSYVVGIRLTESDISVSADLNLLEVRMSLENNRPSIIHSINNVSPGLLDKSFMQIEVMHKGDNEPKWIDSQPHLRMAPSSVMHYNMYVSADTMEAGTYISKVRVRNENQEWIFEQDFVIQAEEIKILQNTKTTAQVNNHRVEKVLLVSSGMVALLIIYLLYIMFKNVRKHLNTSLKDLKDDAKGD